MDKELIIKQFLTKLNTFIKSNIRNEWICLDDLKIYVRKSKRYYKGNIVECLDLATIEVYQKGNGLFTKLLESILEYNVNIFIESILTKRFYYFLLKFGFDPYRPDDNNLIKLK